MTTEADIEGLAMALMAENVGREDLQLHPLEWHWRERFRHQDRQEYRSVARSVLTSDWLRAYVAARVAEALAPIEALAEEWGSLRSRNANAFDYGRWHPAAAEQLRAALRTPEPTP